MERRCRHEPISQIVGKKHFWKYEFFVNKNVLSPRPDSEILIESVLELIPEKTKILNILELGVGSGCLIITLLKEYSNAKGLAVDISQKAIETAKTNAKSLGVIDRISFLKSNWFSKVKNDKKFDLIISNPPYIPTKDIASLMDEVKNFEPQFALDGGKHGLNCYKILAKNMKTFMQKNSIIVLEIGQHQEPYVEKIFRLEGYKKICSKKDLGGIVRCLCFKN